MEEQQREKWVKFKELDDYGIGYSRVHVNRLRKEGLFPEPYRFGPGSSRLYWKEEDIIDWLNGKWAWKSR